MRSKWCAAIICVVCASLVNIITKILMLRCVDLVDSKINRRLCMCVACGRTKNQMVSPSACVPVNCHIDSLATLIPARSILWDQQASRIFPASPNARRKVRVWNAREGSAMMLSLCYAIHARRMIQILEAKHPQVGRHSRSCRAIV